MYALVDGNNFYVSCERVFRPSLHGHPGGLIQTAVGMGARQGLMPLKRFGVARNAASKVACLTARMAPAWP